MQSGGGAKEIIKSQTRTILETINTLCTISYNPHFQKRGGVNYSYNSNLKLSSKMNFDKESKSRIIRFLFFLLRRRGLGGMLVKLWILRGCQKFQIRVFDFPLCVCVSVCVGREGGREGAQASQGSLRYLL